MLPKISKTPVKSSPAHWPKILVQSSTKLCQHRKFPNFPAQKDSICLNFSSTVFAQLGWKKKRKYDKIIYPWNSAQHTVLAQSLTQISSTVQYSLAQHSGQHWCIHHIWPHYILKNQENNVSNSNFRRRIHFWWF